MVKINPKMILGLAFISIGVFLQVLWIVLCFSFIFVGIILLLFFPRILFLPFNIFFELGMRTIDKEFRSNNQSGYYRRYNYRYYGGQKKRDQYSYIYTQNLGDTDKYYKILESKSTDSFDIIKKNYRRLIKKYHYDVNVSQHLSEVEMREYEEKTKEINEAYSVIKKRRG